MNEDSSLEDRIISVLKKIYDPEIPVDIYELGLIYDIQISRKKEVKILMTLTTYNCPVADILPIEVKEKIQSIKEINNVNVVLTFDPPWDRGFMSEEARLELGML
ncbi:iron-sulfur cluster assembly protein [Blattabacterium punctulatus]|uniref:FeS assembly SUF system protein n=1 Tax=Blattabacterium punctulatus TaxID=164514 RepID=A0ABN5M6E2_9FLAO|nr:iron-sulfur cluster assembly protein [Blattabacterium punctulatus]AWU40143.1 FeS assembly SUF system protein [Blattabacterium punctulatus]AWU40686.1 FeS assembly SUF system protein [Blattabacterium punctulatus]AWU43481.1 FeS assembly SUF system protein [Blattabacterium punctulatus]AWU45136.1 FeS assembly SUF system protein [Blattabacterium punctulatus]AWU46219.1 FeS assembly SUF system protein [Blattabacterium punctulatus]